MSYVSYEPKQHSAFKLEEISTIQEAGLGCDFHIPSVLCGLGCFNGPVFFPFRLGL